MAETEMTSVSLPGTPAVPAAPVLPAPGPGRVAAPAAPSAASSATAMGSGRSFRTRDAPVQPPRFGVPDGMLVAGAKGVPQSGHTNMPLQSVSNQSIASAASTPGTALDHLRVNRRVAMAVKRFKGETTSEFAEPSDGLAQLVGAAMERKRVMDRVRMGFQAVKDAEEKTGVVLVGDENTHNIKLLEERAQSGLSKGKGGGGCGRCYLRTRYHVGNVVTHPAVRYFIISLIVLDMMLFLLEVNGVFEEHHDLFKTIGQIIVWTFVVEVAAKLFAFEKEFFSSWWNIFDFIIVLVSVVMELMEQGLEGLIVGRTLKLFGVLHRSLRVLRIVIKVYTHGTLAGKAAALPTTSYPIELVVNILRKVRFSSVLSRPERGQIAFLINSLIANTLYIPNLDEITQDLQKDSQVPDWIKSNFNSKPMAPTKSFRRHPSTVHDDGAIMRRRTRRLSFSSTTDENVTIVKHVDADEVMDILDDTMDTWEFDVIAFAEITKGYPLFHLFSACMQWHGLPEEIGFKETTAGNLMLAIEQQYCDTSYHNSVHGADVLQTVHVLLVGCRVGSRLSPLQRMCLLLAAAAHDVAHPGLSNNFLVATSAQEAILRNDTSVLEHMHSYRLFSTLRKVKNNVLTSLSRDDYAFARATMIKCILATDLGRHFEFVGQFKGHVSAAQAGQEVADWDLEQMIICLKMADISHPTKPWMMHSRWTQRCMAEFYLQGDMEKRLGIPVSPLMDRETTNIPKAQIGFIKVLVAPLFNAWAEAQYQLGWSDAKVDASAAITPSATWISGSGLTIQPLQLLKQIDANLTANLEKWEAIGNGECKWDADVTDPAAWERMSKRVAPSVVNTSRYINLSNVVSPSFHTLDVPSSRRARKSKTKTADGGRTDAFAKETKGLPVPKLGTPDTTRGSRDHGTGAGAGAGAGAGSGDVGDRKGEPASRHHGPGAGAGDTKVAVGPRPMETIPDAT